MSEKATVYLEDVAEQLEMIDAESHHFLNIKTGEFVSCSEYFPDDDINPVAGDVFCVGKSQ